MGSILKKAAMVAVLAATLASGMDVFSFGGLGDAEPVEGGDPFRRRGDWGFNPQARRGGKPAQAGNGFFEPGEVFRGGKPAQDADAGRRRLGNQRGGKPAGEDSM